MPGHYKVGVARSHAYVYVASLVSISGYVQRRSKALSFKLDSALRIPQESTRSCIHEWTFNQGNTVVVSHLCLVSARMYYK